MLVKEYQDFLDLILPQIESMAVNDDADYIISLGTTNWGLVKALLGHMDDPGATIIGTERLARLTAAIALAEARD